MKDILIVAVAVSGVNLAVIGGAILKGMRLLGGFEKSIDRWEHAVQELADRSIEQGQLLARTAAQLDSVEGRVTRLETRLDNA